MSKRMKGPGIQEDVTPNLIPMIDIMFLLLLFFMLGADMGQREMEEVLLPKAVSVKEDKTESGKTDRMTINVYHRYASGKNSVNCQTYAKGQVCREEAHWLVGIKGRDYKDPKLLGQMIKKEADTMRTNDPAIVAKGGTPPSEKKVMIRADASAYYGKVQEVMNECANAGIYKIECGAARPAGDKKKKVAQ